MPHPIIHVQKWSHRTVPTETALQKMLLDAGLEPVRESFAGGDVFAERTLDYGQTIVIIAGQMTFGFPVEGAPTVLQPGDRLDLPANVRHNAVVGPDGVELWRAKRP